MGDYLSLLSILEQHYLLSWFSDVISGTAQLCLLKYLKRLDMRFTEMATELEIYGASLSGTLSTFGIVFGNVPYLISTTFYEDALEIN